MRIFLPSGRGQFKFRSQTSRRQLSSTKAIRSPDLPSLFCLFHPISETGHKMRRYLLQRHHPQHIHFDKITEQHHYHYIDCQERRSSDPIAPVRNLLLFRAAIESCFRFSCQPFSTKAPSLPTKNCGYNHLPKTAPLLELPT